MKITLQSLEVVNKISQSIKLPEVFLHMYVTKCIELCEEQKVWMERYEEQAPGTDAIREAGVRVHQDADQEPHAGPKEDVH